MSENEPKVEGPNLHFKQGTSDYFAQNNIKPEDFSKKEEAVKAKILEFFNMKNVCFLFGAGTSSPAIPNMAELYDQVEVKISGTKYEKYFNEIAQNVNTKENGKNLEQILGVLYSGRSFFNGFGNKPKSYSEACNNLLKKIEKIIFDSINIKFDKEKQKKVLENYKTFYQKIALRNKDLSRICVFTTNNDLYNERAMDSLNIHYVNGFNGGLTKHFNPAMFNYTYSKRMDISIDKYEPVENMVYLYKIHGSVDWVDKDNGSNNFFSIEEEEAAKWSVDKNILIYPTPTKQNKSLGAPYVDLFREFQHRLLSPNTVLFVIGYGFNDEHVNDIIYRSLSTNTTFNLVIINELNEDKPVCKIDDKRIFRLWGEEKNPQNPEKPIKMHYFEYAVKNWFPDLNAFTQENKVLEDFVREIKKVTKSGEVKGDTPAV
jgi:hypothetical protein